MFFAKHLQSKSNLHAEPIKLLYQVNSNKITSN